MQTSLNLIFFKIFFFNKRNSPIVKLCTCRATMYECMCVNVCHVQHDISKSAQSIVLPLLPNILLSQQRQKLPPFKLSTIQHIILSPPPPPPPSSSVVISTSLFVVL